MRYIHLSDDDVLAAMAKEREVKGGHTSGHTKQETVSAAPISPHNLLIKYSMELAEGFEPPTL
jgi:hypothetical protein